MTKHPLQSLIDAPLANATKINLPEGRRPATRAPKPEYVDEIGVPKLTGKQVREHKEKGRSAKLEALYDYYAGTDLPVERITEHLGLYRNEQSGVDENGKPIMVRVLDTKLVGQQIEWRRKARAA
jgi:hypothetical protein